MRKLVFVEGGGTTKKQQRACRQAFSVLFRNAGLQSSMFRVVACGTRNRAYEDFRLALDKQPDDVNVVLLVDSEGAVQSTDAWSHLNRKDRWERPAGVRAESAHLMVQLMESWFLADRSALADYFGQGFAATALPQGSDIEDIAKDDVLRGIKTASRHTSKPYDKGRDAFAILPRLDVAKLVEGCPHARRLIDALLT